MNAQSYLEWSRLSGLYVANWSHTDRYATYARQLSPAGLATVIVSEFLEDCSPEIDLADWKRRAAHDPDPRQRILLTGMALDTIGARRAAAAIRTAQSDPFSRQSAPPQIGVGARDWETREEIEQRLEQFAAEQAAELQGDLDRHGDPRRAPDFTPQAREQELEQAQQRLWSRQRQGDEVEKLRTLMTQIEKLDDGTHALTARLPRKGAGHLQSYRRQFLDLVRSNRALPPGDLIPGMAAILPQADAFLAAHAALFHPDHFGDSQLRARADALGTYESDTFGERVLITWDTPRGFDVGWTRFSLTFEFSKNQQPAIAALLRTTDRLRDRLPQLAEGWRTELLQAFRTTEAGPLADWELDDSEFGPDGQPTDASILANAGTGALTLGADDPQGNVISARLFFGTAWDEEHGHEIEWHEEG